VLRFWLWQHILLSINGPVLAAILPIQALQQFLDQWGYPVVLVFVLIESTGVPFPGETMLLLGAFFASSGHLSIYGVIAAAAAGAILGDNLGYWVGRKGGRPFIQRFGRYFFVKEKQLHAAERFFARHGDKTVFFGRFISILRTWAAFLAGVNKMRWPVFLFYNAAGGILWAIIYGVIGYFIGRIVGIATIERYSGYVGYGVIAIIVLVVAVFVIRRYLSRRREKQAEAAGEAEGGKPAEPAAQSADESPQEQHSEREKIPPV
jgi:membrane protein DedA with SNARE-associated domain